MSAASQIARRDQTKISIAERAGAPRRQLVRLGSLLDSLTGDHDARIIGVHGAPLHAQRGQRGARGDPPARRAARRAPPRAAAPDAEREELAAQIAGNGGGIDARDARRARGGGAAERIEIARCVNAIHERGVIVKDLDTGLVDFPALRDGEEILLCWRLGEDEVAYWHGLEEGFAGRKRLDPE